ncbi:MAG: orotate phosphoribosyltransferase [Clostridia bacterium]|nr:orotate phosphoribosyltransferase [Clostridia bacterium]
MNKKLVQWLFDTKAIRVCPQDKPFWYTSGTIGPYYINTHFLYGSEEKANALLELIDRERVNILYCPSRVFAAVWENYNADSIYKGIIDEMISFIKEKIPLEEVSYISGGERRDWFFSLVIASILDKPHITIYKDLKAVLWHKGEAREPENISGKVLHIADLITEASSYERAWIPAVERLGGDFRYSLVVVDRKQGGEEFLKSRNIEPYSMAEIDKEFFKTVFSMGIINEQQYQMLEEYVKNPREAMRQFLLKHPDFLENALKAGDKNSERAKLCVEKNIYGL